MATPVTEHDRGASHGQAPRAWRRFVAARALAAAAAVRQRARRPPTTPLRAETTAETDRRPSRGATLSDGDFGEKFTPDPDILARGLGGAGSLPTEERARNVALATITRASTTVDEDLALKCWKDNGCDTGTGAS